MKLYKVDFTNTIGNNVVTVPTDSEFLLGLSNGDASATVKLFDGETELEAMEDKIGKYTVFQFETSGVPSRKHYKSIILGNRISYDYKDAWTYELTNSKADILVTDSLPWSSSEELRPEKVEVRYRDANGEVLGTVKYHFATQVVSGGTLRVTWKIDDEYASEEYVCQNIWFKAKASYQYNIVAFKEPGEDAFTEITKDEVGTLVPVEVRTPYREEIDIFVICQNLSVAYRDLTGGSGGSYVLPEASASTLGGIKVGANLAINDGVLSTHAPYVLPTASNQTIGGVKIGNGLSMDANGILSTTGLVTSIDSSSTDAQYPSAKCVYDLVGDVETLINAI